MTYFRRIRGPAWLVRICLLVAATAACSEPAAEGAATVPAGDDAVAAVEESPALDCVAGDLYASLAGFVTPFQAIRRERPQQDTYETEAAYAARVSAWTAAAGASADSLRAALAPVIVRREVQAFRYDPEGQVVIVENFGPLAVPGVVVEADLQLPYPAAHCLTGPLFTCAAHTSEDSWRTAVVGHRVPLRTGPDARFPLAREAASAADLPGAPLEFEAVFALASIAGQDPLLPVIRLQSARLLAGGQVVTTWEGEPTLAGRTTMQRMISFVPETIPTCS